MSNLYDDISYKTMTFHIGMFWSDISALAYNGDINQIDQIISFNRSTIPELQRKSIFITEELTLLIPELSDNILENEDLPSWR